MIIKNTSSTKINSVPIGNSKVGLQKLVDNMTLAYKSNKKNISKTIDTELENKFGKHHLRKRFEFLTKIWFLDYNNITFVVFTAKNKGTTIEINNVTYDDVRNGKYDDTIVSFIDELYKLIN